MLSLLKKCSHKNINLLQEIINTYQTKPTHIDQNEFRTHTYDNLNYTDSIKLLKYITVKHTLSLIPLKLLLRTSQAFMTSFMHSSHFFCREEGYRESNSCPCPCQPGTYVTQLYPHIMTLFEVILEILFGKYL